MKLILAIISVLCVQAAMSPLCLCADMWREDAPARSCCCPATTLGEEHPCPHCDHADDLVVPTPVKGVSAPDAPEFHGFLIPAAIQEFSPASTAAAGAELPFFQPRRPTADGPRCALFGVFLI